MKSILKNTIILYIAIIAFILSSTQKANASHAQGTDITYQCLGGNQYQINLSFYRDCAGVAAPTTVSVNVSSASCGQNFNITLNRVAGTGIDVTPICPSLTTQCSGGTYPGVQEYLYTGIVTLPAQCIDWVFGFTLCCRNAAISTIVNPSGENIYVESTLNNLNFNCNSSPSFLNKPVPFVCVGQPYCYNNGANEIDGDSVYYRLVVPKTSPTTTVTYNAGYTANQPLSSSPAITFNNSRGDICMFPNLLQVTVFAIIVEEWRNGIMVGSVMRDIQLKTIACTNTNPYVNGINNTGNYSLTACAGTSVNFTIPTFDPDAAQNVTITWDNGISGGTFISSAGARPTATFSWTPTAADISSNPYCFTITVKDNNCVYFGSQVFSFCITVEGFSITTSATNSNCGASNGTATVLPSSVGLYTYSWLPNGGNGATANGLQAGTYTVTTTSSAGCSQTASVTVGNNGGPLNVNLTTTTILCYGATNGSIIANAAGGQPPYTYLWSNGVSAAVNTSLSAGTYSVIVTSNNGCSSTVASLVDQPSTALTYTLSQSNVTCFGLTNGSATITASGGTAPYTYLWNTNPAQTASTITNLAAGNYSVQLTDANGCSTTANVIITQPTQLSAISSVSNNVACFSGANGAAIASATGGTPNYTYQWNTTPIQTTAAAAGLAAGNYTVIIRDINNCTALSSILITQPTVLSVSTSVIHINCNGAASGQAQVVANGGTPNYSYQWAPSGGTNAIAINLNAATYTVTVSDNNGCSQTASVIITEPLVLLPTLTQTDVTCFGANNGTSTITLVGGIPPYSYSWNTTPVQTTATAANLASGTYTVVATDANGCRIASSVTINQPTPLIVSGSVINNVTCFGLANGSATVAASGGTTPYSYQWNTNPIQTTQSIGGLAHGNYSVIVTDNNNCVSSASISIIQPALLTISTSKTNVTCNGSANGTASVVATGGVTNYTYQWLPNGSTNASVNGLAPAIYTVLVSDANNCTQSATITISEPSPIIVSATGNTTICLGQSTPITASATGGNSNYTYTWIGNGTLLGANQTVNPTTATTYVVSVNDAMGCPGNPVAITVNVTSLTLGNLTVSPGTRICEGSTATLYSTVNGNTGPVTISWNNGVGNGSGPFVVSPTSTTTYIVSVTDACNNTVTASVLITVSPLPVVTILPLSVIACEEAPLTFANTATNTTTVQHHWDFGDGTSSTNATPTHIYTNSGVYNVHLILTSIDGCVDSSGTTATITVFPNSEASFESEALDGTTLSPMYKFINTSANTETYTWNFGDGTTVSSIFATENTIVHEYKEKGEYLVLLTTKSHDGCVDTAKINILITPEFAIYIPNAFTPDGDGTNDVFIPKGIEIITFTMEIYSRWGEMIYRTNDLTKGWDGRANFGMDVSQSGVYVYKISVKDLYNKNHDFTGHVTLIKNEASE